MDRSEITRRREALGLSMSALGREAGLHPSTVSTIESGRLNPYPVQLEKLRAAFERLEAAKNEQG